MRVYVSGPMRGLPKEEYTRRFRNAEERLKAQGHTVINPCDLDKLPLTEEEYMEIDLILAARADAVYMLKGWEKSKGACQEKREACIWGREIMYEEEL